MFLHGHLIILDVGLLRDIFDQDFMLYFESKGGSNIYLGVEPLIPLVVGEVLLMKTVNCHFLFIHGGKWVLIFCSGQDGLLIKGHEIKWIISRACGVPIGIVLHLVLKYLCALTSHH